MGTTLAVSLVVTTLAVSLVVTILAVSLVGTTRVVPTQAATTLAIIQVATSRVRAERSDPNGSTTPGVKKVASAEHSKLARTGSSVLPIAGVSVAALAIGVLLKRKERKLS